MLTMLLLMCALMIARCPVAGRCWCAYGCHQTEQVVRDLWHAAVEGEAHTPVQERSCLQRVLPSCEAPTLLSRSHARHSCSWQETLHRPSTDAEARGGRNCALSLLRQSRGSAAHSKPSHHRLHPLPLISFICRRPCASRFEQFATSASQARS